MGMNKNTILGWATLLMIVMGLLLIGLGAFRYRDVSGWGFAAVGVGFLANAWVFSSLKGRLQTFKFKDNFKIKGNSSINVNNNLKQETWQTIKK